MKILKINNDKGFTNNDLTQVKKILKPTEFKVKRSTKKEFEIFYTGTQTNPIGMFEFVHELISTNFKPSSENAKEV